MKLVIILRLSWLKGILGVLLIAMFAIKSCDVFIHYYTVHNKAASAENPADNEKCGGDESRDLADKSFEKSEKKLYSCFDYSISFKPVVWANYLRCPEHFYSFGSFTEPFRVVLTPPPDSLFS